MDINDIEWLYSIFGGQPFMILTEKRAMVLPLMKLEYLH